MTIAIAIIGAAIAAVSFALGRITSPQRTTGTLHYYDGMIDGVEKAAASIRRTYRRDPRLTVGEVLGALDDVVSNARRERHTAERWTP